CARPLSGLRYFDYW
nr:immunoglobulin heavy chain junction region [Mus musculus]